MQNKGTGQTISPPSHGVLLINTGTPDVPTHWAVRRFLAQFLMDRRVIDYPRWIWMPLLYGIILNVRPRRSAKLYRRIWSEDGSPIITISQHLKQKLQEELAGRILGSVQVEIGMRYGNPSIAAALAQLRKLSVSRIIVLPLFPQYSGTTTGTILEAVFAELRALRWFPSIQVISDYHDHPAYVDALAESIRPLVCENEKLLFSFHGIPHRYVRNGDPYEEHCKKTVDLVTEHLNMEPERWSLAYQSRFGPEAWLQPYTDQVLESWGREGLGNICVVCPGFAVDCLETLEEIKNEGRHLFLESGGRTFKYVPALNDRQEHVKALAKIISESDIIL